MPELRRLARELFDRPLVPTPALDDVAARASAYRQRRQVRMAAVAVACVLGLSAVVLPTIGDDDGRQLTTAGDPAEGADLPVDLPPPLDGLPIVGSTTTTSPPPTTHPPNTTTTTRPGGGGGEIESCPGGQNAGATDNGVTADRVTVAVRFGPGKSTAGVRSVLDAANRQGGVCGRRLDFRVLSAHDPLPHDGEFLALIPDAADAELENASRNNAIPFPVVGAEGLGKAEYESPWVWPVGTPAALQARFAVRSAYSTGSRTFGIVWQQDRPVGAEARAAFREHVRALTGADPKAEVALASNKGSYASEANQFNQACGTARCDFVLLALEAPTAITYLRDQSGSQGFGRLATSGTSTLFSAQFARDCGAKCNDMWLWTPFLAPVGDGASDPEAVAYVNAVKSVDPGIDPMDGALERTYLAARLLLRAVEQAGANLTRARLQEKLDALVFDTSLTAAPLDWGSERPNGRVANRQLRAYAPVTGSGSFSGFRDVSGWNSPFEGPVF